MASILSRPNVLNIRTARGSSLCHWPLLFIFRHSSISTHVIVFVCSCFSCCGQFVQPWRWFDDPVLYDVNVEVWIRESSTNLHLRRIANNHHLEWVIHSMATGHLRLHPDGSTVSTATYTDPERYCWAQVQDGHAQDGNCARRDTQLTVLEIRSLWAADYAVVYIHRLRVNVRLGGRPSWGRGCPRGLGVWSVCSHNGAMRGAHQWRSPQPSSHAGNVGDSQHLCPPCQLVPHSTVPWCTGRCGDFVWCDAIYRTWSSRGHFAASPSRRGTGLWCGIYDYVYRGFYSFC